jgi:hypothetical protein
LVTVPRAALCAPAGEETRSAEPADAVCEQRVPVGRELVVECELDRCLKPDERDNRERGIVVRGIEIGRA